MKDFEEYDCEMYRSLVHIILNLKIAELNQAVIDDCAKEVHVFSSSLQASDGKDRQDSNLPLYQLTS